MSRAVLVLLSLGLVAGAACSDKDGGGDAADARPAPDLRSTAAPPQIAKDDVLALLRTSGLAVCGEEVTTQKGKQRPLMTVRVQLKATPEDCGKHLDTVPELFVQIQENEAIGIRDGKAAMQGGNCRISATVGQWSLEGGNCQSEGRGSSQPLVPALRQALAKDERVRLYSEKDVPG